MTNKLIHIKSRARRMPRLHTTQQVEWTVQCLVRRQVENPFNEIVRFPIQHFMWFALDPACMVTYDA